MPAFISIDIWDTLLRRRCHPDEVKLYTARYIYLKYYQALKDEFRSPRALLNGRVRQECAIGARRRAQGLDDEYAIEETCRAWLESVLRSTTLCTEEMVTEAIRIEEQHESDVSYEDSRIRSFLKSYPADALVAVSDFYMRAPFCTQILQEKCPWLAPRRVYSSCDHGLNKRSGRLFSKILQSENIDAHQHLHIGDDPKADVQAPSRLGAQSLLYENPDEQARRAHHAKRFKRRWNTFTPYIRDLQQLLSEGAAVPQNLTSEQKQLYHIGRSNSLIFFGLVLRAVETALKEGIGTIYYISREGRFFQKIHERISSQRLCGLPVPAAEHLELSRLSTFLPTLREISCEELMRLWCFYPTQSPRALLSSLGADSKTFFPLLDRHGLDPDLDIETPWQHSGMRSFLSDRAVRDKLEAMKNERRRGLTSYLAEKGLPPSPAKVLLVDIGWKGTIQDNLAYLFPDTLLYGCYLALQKFAAPQPPNVVKESFGPNENSSTYGKPTTVRCIAPWEMLCTSGEGSAVSYAKLDNRMSVRREYTEAEHSIHTDRICFFQEGVLSGAQIISDWASTHAVTSDEIRPYCLKAISALSADPPPVLIQTFFSYKHNETFGLGRCVDMRGPSLKDFSRAAARSLTRPGCLKNFLIKTRWPYGYLKLYRLNKALGLFKRPFP